MAAAQLDLSAYAQELAEARSRVLAAGGSGAWAVFAYDAGTNALRPSGTGDGGLDELKDEFDEGRIQYAFAKVAEPLSGLPKLVLICWCGEGVPVSKKGLFNYHINTVASFFKGFHVQINARAEDDVNPDVIMKKVKDSAGAKYSIQKESDMRLPAAATAPPPRPAPVAPKPSPAAPKPAAAPPKPATPAVAAATPKPTPAPVAAPRPVPKPQTKDAADQDQRRIRQEQLDRERRDADERARRDREDQARREQEAARQKAEADAAAAAAAQLRREQEAARQKAEADAAAQLRREREAAEKAAKMREQQEAAAAAQLRREREAAEKAAKEKEQQEAVAAAAAATDITPTNTLTATALYDYVPTESNEIQMTEGEIITQIIQLDEGWWQGTNTHGQTGLFPANYVQLNEPAANAAVARHEPEHAAYNTEPVAHDAEEPGYDLSAYTNTSEPTSNTELGPPSQEATALFDYDASESNELTLRTGDRITNIVFVSDDWWQGSLNGAVGLFPGNYVELSK